MSDLSDQTRERCLDDLAVAWRIATTGPGRAATATGDPEALGQVLYTAWWAAANADGRPGATAQETAPGRSAGALTAALRAALPPEPRWYVSAERHGLLQLARRVEDGTVLIRTATEDDILDSSRPGTTPRPGDMVVTGPGLVSADRSWWWWQNASPTWPATGIERLYLDLSFSGALRAMPVLVEYLAGLPTSPPQWRAVKCPLTPAGFARGDSTVVYLTDGETPTGLPDLCARLSPFTRGGHQPLTTLLAPGVSRAQDPGDGLSFGQVRCRTVAWAVLGALGDGGVADGDEPPVRALAEWLARAGIDLDAPGGCGLWETVVASPAVGPLRQEVAS